VFHQDRKAFFRPFFAPLALVIPKDGNVTKILISVA